jgi:hypothetical protein
VHQLHDAAHRHRRHRRERHRQCIACEGEGHQVEIARRKHLVVRREDERVVRRGVELELAGGDRALQRIGRRAVNLRQATKRQRILDRACRPGVVERRALDPRAKPRGGRDLSERGVRCGEPGIEDRGICRVTFERQRGRLLRVPQQSPRRVERKSRHPRGQRTAVAQREPILRSEDRRCEMRRTQRLRPGKHLVSVFRESAADDHEGNVREKAQVARADGAPSRHDRRHAAIEERNEKVEHGRRNPRAAERHAIRARQHRGADDGTRQRLPDADCAPDDELRLERGDFLRRQPVLEIAAEARVEPVDRTLARRGALDDRARCRHALARLRRKRNIAAILTIRVRVRDARQRGDVESFAR